MKKHLIVIILLLSISVFSCKAKSKNIDIQEQVENFEPKVNIKDLQSDFIKWWTYYNENITLTSNFIGLNETSDLIYKKQFLEQLTSGNFIPLKLKSKDETAFYKLYELDTLSTNGIGNAIKNEALSKLKHFNMEGEEFPEFDFTDLNNNHYTNENTKGKSIVFKTWFINCQACVAEFPELNEFVEKLKNREDILFISLAIDSRPKLEKFLQKRHFEYGVVPNQKDYIVSKLNLQTYPTHIIVDPNGRIQKVANKASEIISFLENEKSLIYSNSHPIWRHTENSMVLKYSTTNRIKK